MPNLSCGNTPNQIWASSADLHGDPPSSLDCCALTHEAERNPIVRVVDGEAMADSRDVARFFTKDHKRILQTIRELHCSAEFGRHNFVPFKINDLTGVETTSHVMMTKDGFTFLAMGFTGARAGGFKERYIAQFNAMEAELRRRPQEAVRDAAGCPDKRCPDPPGSLRSAGQPTIIRGNHRSAMPCVRPALSPTATKSTDTPPLRPDVTVALAFPNGSLGASGLRREATKGRLAVERIAGKDYTTLEAIKEMRERCRVPPKAPACGSGPRVEMAPAGSPTRQPGSSSTEDDSIPLASALLIAKELRERSRNNKRR